jgi:hypothetical protein
MRPRPEWEAGRGVIPSASSSSECSDVFDQPSYNSQSTHPTQYSLRFGQVGHCEPSSPDPSKEKDDIMVWADDEGPRGSQTTYSSTLSSEDDMSEFSFEEGGEIYHEQNRLAPAVLSSTPRNFDQYFPSRERLLIRHDDTTLDGNMNLRVDTQFLMPDGKKRPLTLFHLRMYDLKSRDFSLRRYCRESGREVCNSARQYQESHNATRPGLQRSLSNALASLRRRSSSQSHGNPQLSSRNSEKNSMNDDDQLSILDEDGSKQQSRQPTNVIKLEFSNYAHIDVVRCSSRSSSSWKFDYWGNAYYWKKQVDEHGNRAYRLFRSGTEFPCAHIVQDVLTTQEAATESRKGGWVPPCSLWITDDQIATSPDVAEYVHFTSSRRLMLTY